MASAIRFSVGIVLLVGVCAHTGDLRGQTPEPGRGYPSQDWPLAGGNWSGTRYSTLAEITPATVGRLGGAWVTRLEGGAASRATPIVRDGVIYLTGGANVFAIDARTGDQRWRWQPEGTVEGAGMVPSWQGVGLGDGLVFVGLLNGQVAALSQDTGEMVWLVTVGSDPPEPGEAVTTAPMYAAGRVFVGLANGDTGGQGRIMALDAETGETQWTFFIVPRPGEFGHDTWPQDSDTWELGGGGVWLVGTVDPDLGLVYFSTGNPAPMFGGEIRAGDNLFTASVVALDMATGERRWHYQVVRHDVWDADIATPLLLYDHDAGTGEPRKAVAAMRADGLLFLFDRETGEPLTPIEERAVPQDAYQRTAATQPFPQGAESILPDCSFWRDRVPPPFELNCSGFTPPMVNEHTIVAPGVPIPRVRVTPMSFSPQTGYIYAQGQATVGRARRFEDPFHWRLDDNELTLPDPVGILAAVDTRTNRVVWKHEMPASWLGTSGPLTTAGGLMFRGSAGGQVEAYDARTGTRAWTFRTSPTGTLVRPGPASVYALDGRQHIAITMGTELWSFVLDGEIPARGEPVLDPWEDYERPQPEPTATRRIETATLIEGTRGMVGGTRYGFDEHHFNPTRALVRRGARLQFINNGEITHTIAARDGSWSTGPVEPASSASITLGDLGTFLYHCIDHPWAIGQITVEDGP
ncbi:MAG: PQQ-binding-like beta-propeller repeat protein [Acidobacteria bacterium]|nr:PQQ-binding-like beta-propeller repeat protein [Acidobacteriota bacterium]